MKFYLIIIFVVSFHSCKDVSDNRPEKNLLHISKEENDLDSPQYDEVSIYAEATDTIVCRDQKLGDILLIGLRKADFSIERSGGTNIYKKIGYEGLENAIIGFDSENSHDYLKGKVAYGVSQMTFDDIPDPNFLNFSMVDTISISKDDQGQFPIGKHLYDLPKLVSVFQTRYLNEIRKESIIHQVNFYKSKLKEKSLYDCCPEYVAQAEKFLEKKINDFQTLDDLSVFPSYKKVTLELKKNTWLVFYNYSKVNY